MISPDVIIPFDGANAAIPAGFTRDTRFDGKYLKLATSSLATTGGASTHTHVANSHTHTYASNGHAHNTGTIQNNPTVKTDAQHLDSPPYDVSTSAHTHYSVTSGVMTDQSITTTSATIGTASNEVSRYHYIFLLSQGYNFWPTNSIILRNDTASREGCAFHSGSVGRYMKGAAAGQDAGSATDAVSHTHSQTHSHTMTHGHGQSGEAGLNTGRLGGGLIDSVAVRDHTHVAYFDNHSEVVTNSDNLPSVTNDLAYRELHHWKATQSVLPKPGDIAFFLGSQLPVGWSDLGWSDVYVKGKTQGQSLTTGGSLTHTHAGLSHSHAGSNHTHTYTTSTATANGAYRNGGSQNIAGTHSHTGTTTSATNATTSADSLTVSTNNHEPEYIKVRIIKMDFLTGTGAAIIPALL